MATATIRLQLHAAAWPESSLPSVSDGALVAGDAYSTDNTGRAVLEQPLVVRLVRLAGRRRYERLRVTV